ncbi:HTH_Tnp_Tc3_2 domain-containing protein [Trichonephila clavipes]|nr:HTH_Tnp_Tc3_2 domain-containing protein [Trichonephila clavipes]
MAGYQNLSKFEYGVIFGTRDMGHIISELTMELGFPCTTISPVYHRYRESATVTTRTIQRNIINMGFRSQMPTRVPLMTARYKALRLAWPRQHRSWTVDDWKYVAWSDESRFQLNLADGRVRV